MDDAMLFFAFLAFLGLILAVGAWWSDRVLERKRPRVPKPQRRAVVGESHKPWM